MNCAFLDEQNEVTCMRWVCVQTIDLAVPAKIMSYKEQKTFTLYKGTRYGLTSMDGCVDIKGNPANMSTSGRWRAAGFLMGITKSKFFTQKPSAMKASILLLCLMVNQTEVGDLLNLLV